MPIYSSFSQFARQQGRNWLDATDANKVVRQAVVTLVPVMKNRIQQNGKNSAGGQIGQYGEKKIARAFGVAQGFASKRRLKKVTGQEGYKELRQKLGLQTAFVDLTFSGDMMRSFKPGPTGSNGYGIGFISETEIDKAAENEKRYGRVFGPTDQENKLTLAEINRASLKLLSR
jgi:hypothetical protein